MGAILSCATDSHNIYTINRNKKLLFLTHPSLIPFLYNQNEKADEDSYYARKLLILKNMDIWKISTTDMTEPYPRIP